MNVNEVNEKILVDKAKQDPTAFGQLYDVYFAKIYNYVYFRVKDRFLAEDLTGEVFFKALDKLHTFTWKEKNFACWLYRIARNVIIDHYRKQKNNVPLEDISDRILGDQPGVDAGILADSEFFSLVKELTPDQADVVVLRFQQELSLKEIANILGKNENAIKGLLFRALNTLKNVLNSTDKGKKGN